MPRQFSKQFIFRLLHIQKYQKIISSFTKSKSWNFKKKSVNFFTLFLQEVQDEEPLFSLKEYLSRLANAQSRLYGNSYGGSDLIMPDMLRDRRRSSAENNFQLRVRKRAGPRAESNFQLRVRKNILDRLRAMPQTRSAAEDNFQLR